MPAMYPLDMKEEVEAMHEAVCYLKSIGFSYTTLDELLDVPSGAVRSWIFRGADGFHPLLAKAGYELKFWIVTLLCSFLGVWEGMEREIIEKIFEGDAWEQQSEYWKGFRKDILNLGGVSAYKGGYRREEVTVIPKILIRRNGLKPDQIAQILADYFPGYGVETEQCFYDICERYGNFLVAQRLKKASL